MKSQRGGFALGLIVGLLIGLALALAVALYVTKVPVPFVNKVPQRTAEQDAAEQEKNKNWDPNAGLGHKPGTKPPAPAGSAPAPAAAAPASAPPVAATPPARDPAAILSARETSTVKPTPAADPFNYFVQAGAFAKPEDAEQQRARLAMMGYEAKVTEREQSGRTVYRVRIGPFPAKDTADGAKDKLAAAGVESALVRVQK